MKSLESEYSFCLEEYVRRMEELLQGIPDKELADVLCVTDSTANRIRHGQVIITVDKLDYLVEHYLINPIYLITGDVRYGKYIIPVEENKVDICEYNRIKEYYLKLMLNLPHDTRNTEFSNLLVFISRNMNI